MRRWNIVLAGLLLSGEAAAGTVHETAVHFAPILYQDTANGFPNDWRNRRYDLLTRIDFDGDLLSANNWANAESFELPAYVYYEAIETSTHVFLTYGFFHPRDWEPQGCFHPLCHENDQENYRLTIAKDGTGFGTPILLDGDSHGSLNAWSFSPSVTAGRATLRNDPPGFDGSHVRMTIEAKGHGPNRCGDAANCLAYFGGADGVVYSVTADGGAPPLSEVDVSVDGAVAAEYGLLPSFETLWPLVPADVETAFDANGQVTYVGGRGFTFPFPVGVELNSDEFGSQGDGHTTWGVNFVSGGADALLDWAFDPALSVKEHFTIAGEDDPALFSMTYTCHPYFGVFESCPERRPAGPTTGGVPERVDLPSGIPAETTAVEEGYPSGCGCRLGGTASGAGAAVVFVFVFVLVLVSRFGFGLRFLSPASGSVTLQTKTKTKTRNENENRNQNQNDPRSSRANGRC